MKRLVKFLSLVLLALVCLAGTLALAKWLGLRSDMQPVSQHTGLTIEQVQALAELVTLKIPVSAVQETEIRGYVGGRKVTLVVKGEILIGVDLSQAKFEAMNRQAGTATLVLPQPRSISAKLDHAGTHIADDQSEGLWVIVPGDAGRTAMVNRSYAEAQSYLSAAADDKGLIEKSRQHAEEVLASFFASVGWTVTVKWHDY